MDGAYLPLSYTVNSLSLRFDVSELEAELAKLTTEGIAASHSVDDGAESADGGAQQLMPEMVR